MPIRKGFDVECYNCNRPISIADALDDFVILTRQGFRHTSCSSVTAPQADRDEYAKDRACVRRRNAHLISRPSPLRKSL